MSWGPERTEGEKLRILAARMLKVLYIDGDDLESCCSCESLYQNVCPGERCSVEKMEEYCPDEAIAIAADVLGLRYGRRISDG